MSDEMIEKTEAPTLRKREEARREGRAARSGELTAAAALLGGATLLIFRGPAMLSSLREMLQNSLGNLNPVGGLRSLAITPQLSAMATAALQVLGPVIVAVLLLGLLCDLCQVGFHSTLSPLAPRWQRLSPLGGLRRTFSAGGMWRLLMNFLKLIVVGAVCLMAVSPSDLRALSSGDSAALPAGIGELIGSLAVKIAVALLVLGAVDYAVHRRLHERELRMTPQEIREDQRLSEGDPLTRQRRAKQRKNLTQAGPKALRRPGI